MGSHPLIFWLYHCRVLTKFLRDDEIKGGLNHSSLPSFRSGNQVAAAVTIIDYTKSVLIHATALVSLVNNTRHEFNEFNIEACPIRPILEPRQRAASRECNSIVLFLVPQQPDSSVSIQLSFCPVFRCFGRSGKFLKESTLSGSE